MRREHHGGVTRMNTGKFNVFEDAAHNDRALGRISEAAHVGNAIDVHFGCIFEELIDQHRPFGRSFHREAHVMLQLGVRIDDLHCPPAQHETGPHQDGIAELLRDGQRLGFIGSNSVRRLRNV